jgi:hypothetical protein
MRGRCHAIGLSKVASRRSGGWKVLLTDALVSGKNAAPVLKLYVKQKTQLSLCVPQLQVIAVYSSIPLLALLLGFRTKVSCPAQYTRLFNTHAMVGSM